jgi:hypothetical protein
MCNLEYVYAPIVSEQERANQADAQHGESSPIEWRPAWAEGRARSAIPAIFTSPFSTVRRYQNAAKARPMLARLRA